MVCVSSTAPLLIQIIIPPSVSSRSAWEKWLDFKNFVPSPISSARDHLVVMPCTISTMTPVQMQPADNDGTHYSVERANVYKQY